VTRQIAVAVVEHAGCFLIGQRPEGVPLAGLWEFPGGKIEPAETPAEAAIRECREEAGLVVRAVGEYLVEQEEYAHGRVELHFIACQLEDEPAGPPLPPFRWVPQEQLTNYEFPSGNRSLLAMLAGSA
jgi:mutator protein MutT